MTTSVTSLERAKIYLNQSENELCKLQMLFDFFLLLSGGDTLKSLMKMTLLRIFYTKNFDFQNSCTKMVKIF